MKPLLIESSFPMLHNDMTIARAQMQHTGKMPPVQGLEQDVVDEMQLCYVLHLMTTQHNAEAMQVIDTLLDEDEEPSERTPLQAAWLYLAQMTLYVEREEYPLALSSAESSLRQLGEMSGKKRSDDVLAILASLLYNLALIHHNSDDNSRAAKELTKSQQLFERLARKNSERFSAMLLYAVEASADVITSRTKQMNVFAHYQSASALYEQMLDSGDENEVRSALTHLVDTLRKEGDIMLDLGNGRNAVKYYTKALRYQKKLSGDMGYRELTLSIGLARGLMRLANRRAAAEQLLTSLLPLARRLHATREAIEIQNLLNAKNRTVNIMSLIKGIFTIAAVMAPQATMLLA